MIEEFYVGVRTTVSHDGSDFIVPIDPFLRSLGRMEEFSITGDCLAEDLLRRVEDYLGELVVKISATKCTSFEVVPQNKTLYLRDPGIVLRIGEMIPYLHRS